MIGYVVRRLLSALLVLVLTSMIVFTLFYAGPRNPAQALCDRQNGVCTDEKLAALEKSMGLDKSLPAAYGDFLDGLLTPDGRVIRFSAAEQYDCSWPCFGISFTTRDEVTDELKDKYPATLSLAIGGAIIYLTLGVTIGVFAARFRGTTSDRLLVSSTLVISAIPYYLLALLAWIFFTQKIGIFGSPDAIVPTGTDEVYTGLTDNPALWAGGLLLPWLVLGLTNATAYSRYARGQMVETLGEDYIRTATAKGQKANKVVFKHGLRAAIIPVITIFGLDFGTLLGGTIFTEEIFDIDGVGRWGLEAIGNPSNIPVVTATVLVAAFFIIISNLVVDLIYSVLDPRVRLS